jgi:hypothetical protein
MIGERVAAVATPSHIARPRSPEVQHDPLSPNVARVVIAARPYEAYIDFEEAVLAIGEEARRTS